MEEFATLSLRMPKALHTAATELATERGLSLTAYINNAVAAANDAALSGGTTAPSGAFATYEADLRFTLPDDPTSDGRAYRIIDQAVSAAELTGATDVTSRVARLSAMQPRN